MIRQAIVVCVVVASTIVPAQAQVKLERKYVEGTKATVAVETTTNQILTLGGMDVETKVTQFLTMKSAVDPRRTDGTLPMNFQFASVQTEMSLPGGLTFTFDSGNPDKEPDNALLKPVADLYRAMLKMKWTAVLGKDNRVEKVEGLEELAQSADASLKELFNADYLKKSVNQEFGELPDQPVKSGDKWTRTSELRLGSGQTMEFETEYEYAGAVEKDGKTLDQVTAKTTKVTYSLDPNSPSPLKVKSSELKATESQTTILFDRDKGSMVSKIGMIRIQGPMQFEINGQELPGKLDLKIETKTTVGA